jgi:uncharacterized protein YjaZ
MGNNGKRFEVTKFKIGSYKCIVIYEKHLKEAVPYIKSGVVKASKILVTDNDIIITVPTSNDKFKVNGVNGSTSNGHAFSLAINSAEPDWKGFVECTAIHEFNHIIRLQRVRNANGMTLADHLALEGLAQCFAEELTGIKRSWSTSISEAEAKIIWNMIKRKLDVKSRDLFFRIFLNRGDKQFPHWSGYAISYLIIKRRLKELKGKNWNEVIGMSSKVLMKDAGI